MYTQYSLYLSSSCYTIYAWGIIRVTYKTFYMHMLTTPSY